MSLPSAVSPTPCSSTSSSPRPSECLTFRARRKDLLTHPARGRTLEEMDNLFQDSYWIVPLSPAAKVGTHDRERQLAMGKSDTPQSDAFLFMEPLTIHVLTAVQKARAYLPRKNWVTRNTVSDRTSLEFELANIAGWQINLLERERGPGVKVVSCFSVLFGRRERSDSNM